MYNISKYMPFIMKTKVSIIMPSLNVKSYIRECLDSAVNQTLKDIEIICVDAGSTDGTLQIMEEYQKKDKRIVILHSDRRSYGYQVNMGIKFARGEYIGIIETDDFVDERMYEELYDYAKELNADVVKSPYYDFNDDSHIQICYYADLFRRILPKDRCFSVKEFGELLGYHASVWAGLYRKQYLLDHSIFFVEADKAGYVDVGFRIDTCINTDMIAWYDKAYYYYRRNNESSSTNSFDLTVMNKRWKEAHEKLQIIQEEFDQYYAPYLVFDEYMNTIAYIGNIEITKEQLEMMIDNISYVKTESIKKSPVLTDRIKNRLLQFKSDPYAYFRRRNRLYVPRKVMKQIGNSVFPQGSRTRRTIKRILLLRKNGES